MKKWTQKTYYKTSNYSGPPIAVDDPNNVAQEGTDKLIMPLPNDSDPGKT